MKIEILFPELCNLYGDTGNVMLLKQTLPKATFIYTSILEKPRFLDEKIDFVYLATTTEKHQELMIEKLLPFKEEIKTKIDDNTLILATGNSFEIFGDYIINEDKQITALGIFPYYSKRDMNKRHNSLFLGKYNNIDMVGFKSQFSFTYNNKNDFIKVTRGIGLNKEDYYEGVRKNNFFGTYLLGPFLVSNPFFTKYLLNKIGYNGFLAYEEELIKAYQVRLKELKDPKTGVIPKH